jgi:hypothetical protein
VCAVVVGVRDALEYARLSTRIGDAASCARDVDDVLLAVARCTPSITNRLSGASLPSASACGMRRVR